MFVEAAGGVLVCGGLACAGAAVSGAAIAARRALLAAALGCAAADAFGAPSALHAVGLRARLRWRVRRWCSRASGARCR